MDLDLVPCPRCRKRVKIRVEHFPFCSDRCRLLDLGSWFAEDYRLSRPVMDPFGGDAFGGDAFGGDAFGGDEDEGFEGIDLEERS